MKPVLQRIRNPIEGDCLAAAIASILERSLDKVPHFVRLHGQECQAEAVKWLQGQGFHVLHLSFKSYKAYLDAGFHNDLGRFCVLGAACVYARRLHAVVGQVGLDGKLYIAHDPAADPEKPPTPLPPGPRSVMFIYPTNKSREIVTQYPDNIVAHAPKRTERK